MSEVLLALGPAVFYATSPSFQNLKVRAEGRWAAQERLSRPVAHQFLGPQASSVTISGVMYPRRFGGMETIGTLQQVARSGQRVPLISMAAGSFRGLSHGMWLVESVDDDRSFFDGDIPRKLEFTVTVKEYGSDRSSKFGGLF